MADTAYSKRMAELQQKTTDTRKEQLSTMFGLQRRPTTTNGPSIPNAPQAPDESYKDTDFYKNLTYHRDNDEHFKNHLDSFTQLVMGLKNEVDKGYMPKPIAQQRIADYLHDGAMHRQSIDPQVQQEQSQQAVADAANTQMAQAISQMQQGGQGEEGQPTDQSQQAPQEQAPMQQGGMA